MGRPRPGSLSEVRNRSSGRRSSPGRPPRVPRPARPRRCPACSSAEVVGEAVVDLSPVRPDNALPPLLASRDPVGVRQVPIGSLRRVVDVAAGAVIALN
jgi:hypothetical protein